MWNRRSGIIALLNKGMPPRNSIWACHTRRVGEFRKIRRKVKNGFILPLKMAIFLRKAIFVRIVNLIRGALLTIMFFA